MIPTETSSDTSLDTQNDNLTATESTPSEQQLQDHSHEGHEHHHHPAPTLNPDLTRSIQVEASAEDVAKAFQQVTKRYTKLARIPGFRAGKVPPSLIKSRFAKEVRQEVLESLVSDRFRTALEAQKIQPVSQPQISELLLAEGAPLKFKATFEVLPDFNIDGYDSIQVSRPDSKLEDGEFDAELASVLDHHATVEPIEEDRPLVDGDWAEIGFTGQLQDLAQTVSEDGLTNATPQEPISGEDILIQIGGKNTLPAFSDALRNAKVGQELSFEASYPAEFGDVRLAGKTVSYDVTVKAIKKKTYPEKDEEFAKQLGPYTDWADFEAKMQDRVASRKKEALESQARDKMLDELVAKYDFPVPETFVQQQIDARLERGLRALAQQGMSSDDMRKLDFPRLREAQRDQALTEVKISLILDRISERENIEVTDEELERELLMLSIQSREPYDALRKRLTEDGSINRVREQMRREKTGTTLFERIAR
ncbi:MAG: trigger factor [Acidobacteria bacterium]|nr:trigger factor [Acidobacteriota bacterium]